MDYFRGMKFRAVFILFLVCLATGGRLRAQTNAVPAESAEIDVDAVMDAATQFAQDNLDDNVLKALQDVDRDKVADFLKNFQSALNGDSVVDVAPLKDAANTVLPLLDAHAETQPYAAWLRARLDYFDAAEELGNLPPPPPPPGTNQPPRVVNPPFAAEQEIWIKKVSPRPWPEAAKKFVPALKPVFLAEGVPAELVWLAEVESGFDAHARSPAGAVGMFQLMPATAKNLGLSLFPFDQRKQPESAAHAAAKYLRRLHTQFGDWRLAVAAYNCGEGTVEKLLKRHHTTSYEGIATYLPAETQMYVPKVEATVAHREGAALEKLKAA
jgi:membrane-bound lytic murein transglycosylase D